MYGGNPLVPMTGLASVGVLEILDAPLIVIGTAVCLAFATNFVFILREKRKVRDTV